MSSDRIPHSLRFAGDGLDFDSGDMGRWPRPSYGLFLFLLLSFLFHLVMLLLLRQWDIGRPLKNDFPEHSIELINPQKLLPPETRREDVVLGTNDPAALKEIPLGKETKLPPMPKSAPAPRLPKGGGTGAPSGGGSAAPRLPKGDGTGVPSGGGSAAPRSGTAPTAPPAPPPVMAPERSAVPPFGDSHIAPPQTAPPVESPSGADVLPDLPVSSSRVPSAPGAGASEQALSLPSLPQGGGEGGMPGSSSAPARPGGSGGRSGFPFGDAAQPGLLPRLPFADGKQLDQLAKVFSRKEGAPQDSISINSQDLQLFSYFMKIRDHIEYIGRYPSSAARRGLTGDVVLNVTIHRDGRVSDLSVASSSGYDIFDQEALRTVQAASPLAPLPESWKLEQITVPFHFFYLNDFIYVR